MLAHLSSKDGIQYPR